MKQHEREFFIAMIRSGNTYLDKDGVSLVIRPQTIEQSFFACKAYNNAYEQGYIDGMMTEEEMLEWMENSELWTKEDDAKVEGLKKDIEKLKIEIFNARNNPHLRETIRKYIRAGELQLGATINKKHSYFSNTREGFAALEKTSWYIKNHTYINDKLYDFSDLSLSYVIDEWQSSILSDSQIRELARNEPWKSLWAIKNGSVKLFHNKENEELTHNQKNLLIWSQMYDNIQESMDCPSKEAIEDDDVLDGWFIVQAKKREQEKLKQETDENTQSEKIKNAEEVFLMSKSKEDISKIHNMNDTNNQRVKKQRKDLINKRGTVEHHEFFDQRLKIQAEQTNKMRGFNKGG